MRRVTSLLLLALALTQVEVRAQVLDYTKTIDWDDLAETYIYQPGVYLPSGRLLLGLQRDSLYRRGNRPCQNRYYPFTTNRSKGWPNSQIAVFNANGDTSHVVRSPFRFYENMGGRLIGDKIYALARGVEPDSCWDLYMKYSYIIQVMDTSGNVLDSIPMMDAFDHNRYEVWAVGYDDYGFCPFAFDYQTGETLLMRFRYDGTPVYYRSHDLSPAHFFGIIAHPDSGGGYYVEGSSRGVSAVLRADTSGHVLSIEELLPYAPASSLGRTKANLAADGGTVYGYQNGYYNQYPIQRDSGFVVCRDRQGRRRYYLPISGRFMGLQALADNTTLVFSYRDSALNLTTNTGYQVGYADKVDSTGAIVWHQRIRVQEGGSDPGTFFLGYEYYMDFFASPDGGCSFFTTLGGYGASGRDGHRFFYGHISGVQRFDPSAVKRPAGGGAAGWALYPNPATTSLTITGRQAALLKQVVLVSAVGGQKPLATTATPAGYTLRLQEPAGVYTLLGTLQDGTHVNLGKLCVQ